MSTFTAVPTGADVPVIPAPYLVTPGSGAGWRLAEGIRISGPDEFQTVLRQFADDVLADTGIAIALTSTPDAEIRVRAAEAPGTIPAAFGVRADGQQDADERYGLEVAADRALVWGSNRESVHRGLTTLRQLIVGAQGDAIAAVRIEDGPLFAWRGLSLDVVRCFHDVATVKRVIDACALHKLNVLHLHLSDDQGWRLEVPGWPLLTEVGGAGALGDRPGGYYTRADVAEIVAYAAARFVTVVPEIDLPGHCGAVFRAYPELAPEPTPLAAKAAEFGMNAGGLELDRGRTREFVQDVFEALAAQFPTTAYLHIGGDEAFGMSDEAHAAFVDVAVSTVTGLGRLAIGWQETARGSLGPSEIAQYWIEPKETAALLEAGALAAMMPAELVPLVEANLRTALDDVPRALERGARILVSLSARLYLDRPHADPGVDAEQESRRSRIGLPFYPPTSLREMVEWDVLAQTPGATSLEQLAGVEAAVWCETVTGRADLEALLLPRLAGVGERAWAHRPTTWQGYAARLAALTPAWDRRGWDWYRPAVLADKVAASR